jgi:hypothetical protein
MIPAERSSQSIVFVTCMFVGLGTTAVQACSGDRPAEPDETTLGRVSLPLLTMSGGHKYRLRDAVIFVSGPQFVQLSSTDDPDEIVLATTLQTGNYTAYLYSWTLERDDGAGLFEPVPATMTSSNTVPFTIFNGATSTVSYQFRTDGVVVFVGSGAVQVRTVVDEVAAVCVPFGSECSTGTWCAPAGLTGASRACIPSGSVAVGEPCLSPLDCVANASCVDVNDTGAAVCVALCAASHFGVACPSIGTCQQVGGDYGVCRR